MAALTRCPVPGYALAVLEHGPPGRGYLLNDLAFPHA